VPERSVNAKWIRDGGCFVGLLLHDYAFDIVCDVRLVLDTDVVVAALRSPSGGSAALLRAIRLGQATLLITPTLLLEYESVCLVAGHRAASGLTMAEVGRVLDALTLLAEPVTTYFRWRPQLRDPGDEMVLEAAVNGGAHAIVTFDRRDYGRAPVRFGVEVLSPGEALRRVRA
jgi:putative PIN family toxin of toxin-antitoxin system